MLSHRGFFLFLFLQLLKKILIGYLIVLKTKQLWGLNQNNDTTNYCSIYSFRHVFIYNEVRHIIPGCWPLWLPCSIPCYGQGEGGGGGGGALSIQTSDSSTVPHNPLKIAAVWTGQHKEVFFGVSCLHLHATEKEWLPLKTNCNTGGDVTEQARARNGLFFLRHSSQILHSVPPSHFTSEKSFIYFCSYYAEIGR